MSEAEFLNLIMCPYMGNGKNDKSLLNEYLEHEKNLKQDLGIKQSEDLHKLVFTIDSTKKKKQSTLMNKNTKK